MLIPFVTNFIAIAFLGALRGRGIVGSNGEFELK